MQYNNSNNPPELTKQQKQYFINEVTKTFLNRGWFAGAGYDQNSNSLTIAYNFFPALEMKLIKEEMLKFNTAYELRDIKMIQPDKYKDDVPNYMR